MRDIHAIHALHEIALGDVTVTRIEEMHGPIMPSDQFFPGLPEQAWKDHRDTLVPDHLGADDSMVHVAMQTWLLRSEGRTILVDTGVGNDKSRPGVAAWDHLQLDYLGGLACAEVRQPGPGKVLSARDVCPDTGLARRSYGQARALLDQHTAPAGPGTGWDLHEYRRSSLTHLGEAGASELMLMARSRHKKPENVPRYLHPSAEPIAEVTSLLAPGDGRR